MKSILVTGARGYIGSNLIEALNAKKEYRIFAPMRENGCDFTLKNWTQNIPVKESDVVVHLAQSRFYREFPDKADDIFDVNIRATFDLLNWSRTHAVKRFVFSSSGSVYKQEKRKILETDECCPNTMYAASKLCAEHLIRQYSKFFEVVIVRPFSVYGPGQTGNIIPAVIERVKNDEQITLAQDKGMFLTPIFISDCVRVIDKIIFSPLNNRELTVNLSGNDIVSLRDIVMRIAENLHLKPNIQNIPQEPKWLCGDNTLMCGFCRPDISLASGLETILNG
ncbi:MAG: NAD(P)-dependent oxidoreductase [Omnitrophica bacterium]|nr:NAD(P)-dependent oxidoreductase [Candidatus Omnitrophota bacterium]